MKSVCLLLLIYRITLAPKGKYFTKGLKYVHITLTFLNYTTDGGHFKIFLGSLHIACCPFFLLTPITQGDSWKSMNVLNDSPKPSKLFIPTGTATWIICWTFHKCEWVSSNTNFILWIFKIKFYSSAIWLSLSHFAWMGWMKHKLESRLLGEISITSDMQMTPPLWQKAKKN